MASRSGELGDLPSRLERVFEGFPEVSAVYLFGSWALGSARPESDLDLAVVSESPDARAYRLDLLAELAKEGIDNVDLVFLDTADVVLRFEAVRPNRLIYARDTFDHGGYYSKTLRQYFDFLPHLNTQREAYKRRILQDHDQA
jgi:uncharacterized protein